MRNFLKSAGVAVLAVLGTPALAATVVTLAPTSGHPNLPVTVSGSGFAPSEPVDIYIDTVDSLLTVSSATGTLAASVTMPAAAQPGVHYVTAIGRRIIDAAQAPFTVSTNWAEDGFGAAHLGWNQYENTLSPSVVPTLELLWTAPNAPTYGAPIVVSGKMYIGSTNNSPSSQGVYSLNAATGALVWHKTTAAGEQFYGSAAVYDGAIYIQGYTGILYAFNGSGTQLWSTQLGDIGFSGPVVVNGVIYVESGDSVYALNTSGAILWSTATADPIQSNSVAVVNGKVFAVSQDGDLHALNASTGTEIWSYPILSNDANSSTPAVADGIVYVGSANDTFYALRASTGVLIWSATTGGEIVGSPAVAGGVVYIASLDGYLYAFNAADGTTVWKVPLPNGAASEGPVTIADGVVYVGDHQGNVDAFGAQDGQFLLAVGGTGSWVFAQPVVVNGMLYVSSYADDNLYAFAPGGAGANTVPSLSAAPDITSLHPDLRLVPVR